MKAAHGQKDLPHHSREEIRKDLLSLTSIVAIYLLRIIAEGTMKLEIFADWNGTKNEWALAYLYFWYVEDIWRS